MKLIVKCPNCKEENKTPNKHNNRIDYAKKFGDTFSIKCSKCSIESEYHVDNIRAIDYSFSEILKNRIVIFFIASIITFIIGFLFIGFLGGFLFSIISIGVSLILIKKNSSAKNVEFNRNKLKGRTGLSFKK